MSGYKERFRERLGHWFPNQGAAYHDILAFIAEEIAEQNSAAFRTGGNQERQRITSLIEGTKWKKEHGWSEQAATHNQALDDLLSKIRGEETFSEFMRGESKEETMLDVARKATDDQRSQIGLPPLQEETECCENSASLSESNLEEIEGTYASPDDNLTDLLLNKPKRATRCCGECDGSGYHGSPLCTHSDCPCHKPRTEETEKKMLVGRDGEFYPDPAFEETEKDGASFSGRGEEEIELRGEAWERGRLAEREAILSVLEKHILRHEKAMHLDETRALYDFFNEIRPKETTTPQSREQSIEEGKTRCPACDEWFFDLLRHLKEEHPREQSTGVVHGHSGTVCPSTCEFKTSQ